MTRPFRVLLAGLWLLPLATAALATGDEAPPERARDLAYGAALFDYYQGDALAALTGLAVAEARGGVQGHGDHPALLQGGMMLAYGMTQEARRVFEQLLAERLAPETRSLAWYYLGKVSYLERDFAAAENALSRVDAVALETTRPDLVGEWAYLQGQVAIARRDAPAYAAAITRLPLQSAWRPYLEYNHALTALSDQPLVPVDVLASGEEEMPADVESSQTHGWLSALTGLFVREEAPPIPTAAEIAAATGAAQEGGGEPVRKTVDPRRLDAMARLRRLQIAEDSELPESEREALRDRIALTIASFQLDAGETEAALGTLQKVRLEGPLSDQALFGFALAASGQQQWGLALQALQTLEGRPLFNPWVQQVPFALGYLQERVQNTDAALAAYARAADRYRQLRDELDALIGRLDEPTVVAALLVGTDNAPEIPVLGSELVPTDSYGRLKVRPGEFNLAQRIASESFQIALRDLHELYRLHRFLERWKAQLSNVDLIMATREQQLQRKVAEARVALARQDQYQWVPLQIPGKGRDVAVRQTLEGATWEERLQDYRQQVQEAVDREDVDFFLNAEQLVFGARIQTVRDRLDRFPDDHPLKPEFAEKLRRVEGYFRWWSHDTLAANRWAVQREVRDLGGAMTQFRERRSALESLLQRNREQESHAERIEAVRKRVAAMEASLDARLVAARQRLLDLVREDLQRQRREVVAYLLASQQAKARLIDQQFRRQPENPS